MPSWPSGAGPAPTRCPPTRPGRGAIPTSSWPRSSPRRCAAEWGEVVRPDGYGVWREHTTSLPFLYEHDNGTERLERLARKLDGYARLAEAAGHPNWVLFSFGSERREADARRVLAHRVVPVATRARSGRTERDAPDGPVWLPTGTGTTTRLRLVELASLPASRA